MPSRPNWAAWRHDHPAAQHWAPAVTRALNTGLNTRSAQQIARDYGATQPGPRNGRKDAELAAAALAWLIARGIGAGIPGELKPVLRRIRTDGYLLGAASAAALFDPTTAALGDWTPGDTEAAQSQIDELDGAEPDPVLDAAAEASGQVADTHLGRVARALALGVIAGDAPTAVAAAMLAIADRDSEGISLAELLAASGAAAYAIYRYRQIPDVRWTLDARSKNCPRCVANADEGAVPLGHVFSSGNVTAPAHNRCACALLAA